MSTPIPDPLSFFSTYMRLTGAPHLGREKHGDPRLLGKRLGLLNGSSWVAAWSNYFGRWLLPGVTLVNAGNDAVQFNFMQAYADDKPCPPSANIDRFVAYARDLVELANVDAILITCSTMNRSYDQVAQAIEPYHVPVVQIDMPMMEAAVACGGHVLVIATHGPTVASTQTLLEETAARLGKTITYDGATVESAWHKLAEGDIAGHNQLLADTIHAQLRQDKYSSVVLAQLSMSSFLFSYPDPESTFGLPIFTSGYYGFERIRDILLCNP